MSMSVFVFSGSAQFIAILLLGTGSALGVIWLATLILNLRHLLYAATLVDHVRHVSQIWRFGFAAWLTDETFALMERRYREEGRWRPTRIGIISPRASACISTGSSGPLSALCSGREFQEIRHWGLEFAMIVTFTGIVMPALRWRPFWLAGHCRQYRWRRLPLSCPTSWT